ncbi:MAG TPA: OsmC family protein [Rhodopila sp.]|nr:OsmC family protein [Rhodopila sp.]
MEERFGVFENPDVASPSEALLAALGSCVSARIHANAAAGSILVTRLELDVEVEVGASPLWERSVSEPGPVGFGAIRVAVHIDADASSEAIRALVAHAVLWSPIANTLHDPVDLDVTVIAAP